MEFLIADTLTDSLTRLTGEEQKAVKTTAFDLQLNPASPGMKFHKLDRAKDKNFWSVRVNSDLRLIVHRNESSLLLCFAGHHDQAYAWAERRKLEVHPRTGAAQLVELKETILEITTPKMVEAEQSSLVKPSLFALLSDEDLLGYGVPVDWIGEIRQTNEANLLELVDHLPAEAAEALLDLAIGVTPPVRQLIVPGSDPFAHPDARRRFRIMNNQEELERALEYPWEKWTIFLHPAQQQWIEKEYSGPARVSGSAGTGKTVVALHRAVFLARTNPDSRILLTTFSEPLAKAIHTMLRRLISNEPRLGERIEVHAMNAIGRRLYELNRGPAKVASRADVRGLLEEASSHVDGHKFSISFLLSEWEQVVDAWQLDSWEAYRDVTRLGRKTRLPEKQRLVLWSIFERVRSGFRAKGLITLAGMFTQLASYLRSSQHPPFDFVVVDEAQDISVSQLRFLASLGNDRPNSLFFAGDMGQRIYQQAFSWKSLGVDVRGRARTLQINYRTSHQIRVLADRLLAPEVSDVDGNTESRTATISVFNGPQPCLLILDSPDEEILAVTRWISELTSQGLKPHEIGVFVRSSVQLDRARRAVEGAGLVNRVLDEAVETVSGCVPICTMHLAKGLEFRAVVVMACDDDVIPLQERIGDAMDEADLEEVYETERQLLYVACTRARDQLLVTSGDTPSEFLDDLRPSSRDASSKRALDSSRA